MQGRPLVFLDVETTGASSTSSRILEVGALRVEDGKVVKKFKQLIDPTEYVPSFITGLTGITNDDIYGKPIFAQIADELAEMLHGAIFVAHNVGFDYAFIQKEFKLIGSQFTADRLCTVRLSRKLFPLQRSHRLDELIRIHGYKVANRHRAYDDAEVLYKFYKDMLDLHGPELNETLERLLMRAKQPRTAFWASAWD